MAQTGQGARAVLPTSEGDRRSRGDVAAHGPPQLTDGTTPALLDEPGALQGEQVGPAEVCRAESLDPDAQVGGSRRPLHHRLPGVAGADPPVAGVPGG